MQNTKKIILFTLIFIFLLALIIFSLTYLKLKPETKLNNNLETGEGIVEENLSTEIKEAEEIKKQMEDLDLIKKDKDSEMEKSETENYLDELEENKESTGVDKNEEEAKQQLDELDSLRKNIN